MEFREFLKGAASVVPSKRQLDWFDTEFYAFICFTVNTYTDRERGLGNEDPSIFDPTDLDCDEWVAAVKQSRLQWRCIRLMLHPDKDEATAFLSELKARNIRWREGGKAVPDFDPAESPENWKW